MPNIYDINNDKVVGFEKEAEIIINQLLHGSKEREVVLITGMGGLGKTTLARRVYKEKNVVNYFDKRAWCTISQEYDCQDLLEKIYKEVCGHKTEIDSVAEVLRKSLIGRRYLIVLDDIWSVEAWEELNRVFPSCGNGSRIVLTSRQVDVVSDAMPIHLPFFTSDESWKLLQVKLFKGKKCPKELENVGREISKKCRGLPLVVGLIAGLLERVEKSEGKWHEFLLTLISHATIRDGIQSNDAIELSYRHLPDHLRQCLLYFAAYQEDKVIEVSKLIQLWISEGFIDVIEKGRIEDEAEGYLNDLVHNNLIMVHRREYDGRIRQCTVHDLIHDFCLTKAKEENFLLVINKEKKLDPTLNFTPHRICFHRHGDFDFTSELVTQNSSIHTALAFQRYYNGNPGSWIVKSFKCLTILDLEAIIVYQTILSEVNSLIHLRYLALVVTRGDEDEAEDDEDEDEDEVEVVSPLSLANLECLITLKLISIWPLRFPLFFFNMRSLRHMINSGGICGWDYEVQPKSVIEAIPCSKDLQTWILPYALTTTHQHLLRKLPYLKKLCCGASKYPFSEIDFLHHLEYLKLSDSWNRCPSLLNDLKLSKFPSSIKEIKLKFITVSASAISIIAQLPNLEVLKLSNCKFEEGVEWNVEEETQFHKLKYLKLMLDGIEVWNASSESFHCLEQLHLKDFKDLQEVPSSFGDVPTLKVICVSGCNPNVDSSVKKIQEYARDNIGNEDLNVKICDYDHDYNYDYDFDSDSE